MAPSLRLDAALSSEIRTYLDANKASLAVPPHDLVRIAMANPHPHGGRKDN